MAHITHRYEMMVIEGVDRGRSIPLPSTTLRLGRGDETGVSGSRLVLADPTISREQATLRWDSLAQGFLLTHCRDASNATRVNEVPVESRRLQEGDCIRIGHLVLRFGKVPPSTEPDPTIPVQIEEEGPAGQDFTAPWIVEAAWHLAFTSEGYQGRKLMLASSSLVPGRVIPMGGRGSRKNEIPFLDPRIPNRAARIEYRDDRFWLVDEEAGALLRANGKLVAGRVQLRAGDVVRVCETVFVLQQGPPTGEIPWDATTWIEVVAGADDDVGTRCALRSERVRVGRGSDATLVLHDASVSRHHLTIRPEDDDYVLEAASRTNPTLVNGIQVDHERPLAHGDEIQVSGRTVLRFVERAMEIFR